MGQNNSNNTYPLFESFSESESSNIMEVSNSNSIQDDTVKNLRREKRERLLQHIGFVFYLLQTQPQYLSMLVKHALDKMNGDDGSYSDGDEMEYIKLTYLIFNHMKTKRLKFLYLRSIIQLLYMIRLKGNKSLDNLLSILTVEDPVTQRNNYLDKVVETVLSHYHGVDLSIVNLDKMKRRSATVVYYGKVSQYHQEQQEFGNYGGGSLKGENGANANTNSTSTTAIAFKSNAVGGHRRQQQQSLDANSSTQALSNNISDISNSLLLSPPDNSGGGDEAGGDNCDNNNEDSDNKEDSENSSVQQLTTAIAIQTRPSSHSVLITGSGRSRAGSSSQSPPVYLGVANSPVLSSSPTIHELGKQMMVASSPSTTSSIGGGRYSYLGSSPYSSSPINDDRLELRVHTTMSPVVAGSHLRMSSMDSYGSRASVDESQQQLPPQNSILYDSASSSNDLLSSSAPSSYDSCLPMMGNNGIGNNLYGSPSPTSYLSPQTPNGGGSGGLTVGGSGGASMFRKSFDSSASQESSPPDVGTQSISEFPTVGMKKIFSDSISKMKQRAKLQQDMKNFEEMRQASLSQNGGGLIVIGNNNNNGSGNGSGSSNSSPTTPRKNPNLDVPVRSREYTLEKKIQIWENILDKIHDKLVLHLKEAPFEHQYKLAYIHFFLTQIFDYASKSSANVSSSGNKISSTELASAYIVSSYLRINKIRKKLQQVLINNNVRSKESHISQFLDIMSGHDSCLQTKEYKGVSEKASQIKKTILNWILEIKITKQNRSKQQTFLEKYYDIPSDSDVIHRADPSIFVKIGDFLNLAKIMFFNSSVDDEMKKVLTNIRQNLRYILASPPNQTPTSNNSEQQNGSSQKPSKDLSSPSSTTKDDFSKDSPTTVASPNNGAANSGGDEHKDGVDQDSATSPSSSINFVLFCPDRRYIPLSIPSLKYFAKHLTNVDFEVIIDSPIENALIEKVPQTPKTFSDICFFFKK